MCNHELKQSEWESTQSKLPRQPGNRGKATDDRLFINAVLFVVKGGLPWRDLLPRFGNWNTIQNVFG